MNQEQAIERLCKLVSNVADHRFDNYEPTDCFCRQREQAPTAISEKVIEYIEQVVQHRLNEIAAARREEVTCSKHDREKVNGWCASCSSEGKGIV